jgi:hypothetical protein
LDTTHEARASLTGTQAPDCTMVWRPRLAVELPSGTRRQALKRQLLGLDAGEDDVRTRHTHGRLSFHQLAWIEARCCRELFE